MKDNPLFATICLDKLTNEEKLWCFFFVAIKLSPDKGGITTNSEQLFQATEALDYFKRKFNKS